ncbi:MAG TPA: AraC family transcriptional regulator, partial [Mobilitalea sp.]|nr:AraC family transcriptional regulator [Mobilitalea sp.]
MELYTRSYDREWNRIVHLYVKRQDDLKTYINDSGTCKLVLVKKGNGVVLCNNKKIHVIAPALLFFNHEDKVQNDKNNVLECDVIYFKPEVINDELKYDVLTGKNGYKYGISTLQDRYLLNEFYKYANEPTKFMMLREEAMIAIQQLIRNIEKELIEQKDGYWPCRSRSFFIELLFYIDRQRQFHDTADDFSIIMLSQSE